MTSSKPRLGRLHLAMRQPEDVIDHLGKPTHWKQGRSAKAIADSWFAANDIPGRIRTVLAQDTELSSAELVDAILERPTDLGDQRGSPTQTDLLALLALPDRLAVMAVEGKMTESFGPLVSEWLASGGPGKAARLTNLCQLLGLDETKVGGLRYQLLHRTAAAILEARRYRANDAILMVHSFCPSATGLTDFIVFAEQLGFARFGRDMLSEPRQIGDLRLRLGWASDAIPTHNDRVYRSVDWLNDFGRTRLSKSFFMRDFLYSDIAAIHGFSNIPDDPELAIGAGTRLCEELLEPLQGTFGRLAIRSAYRSAEVNGFGNRMQNQGVKGYNCASNEANAAGHIWDMRDADGCVGATACIVIPSFWERWQSEQGGWQRLAWWIHDHLPYSSLYFFPTRWAFNITWHERPERRIDSYVTPKGCLTKSGMANQDQSHEADWRPLLDRSGTR